MAKKHTHGTLLVCCAALLLLCACHRRMAPTLTAGVYNDKKNVTEYTVIPYGGVALPGKWIHGRYRKESRQQYFSNFDSTVVSIAFGPCDKLGFPTHGATGYEFVKLQYEWESRYENEIMHQHIKLITADSVNKYMLWQIYGDNVNQFYLCGAKDCSCGECAFQNFAIGSRKLSDDQQAQFLRDIYLEKSIPAVH